MAENVGFQVPFKLISPDGSVTVYSGGGKIENTFEFVSAEASATFSQQEAVRLSAATVLCSTTVAANVQAEELYGLRVASAADVAFLGVCLQTLLFGKKGWAAGSGSMLIVNSLTSASLTSNANGATVIGSATAGAVNATTNNAAGSATALAAGGTKLGIVIKIAGTTGGATDTGSATQLGVLVSPW